MFKKVRRILVILLLIAVAAFAVWFFGFREKETIFTQEVARIDDVETFYTFTGHVECTNSQRYVALTSNRIEEWLVEEGDQVTTEDGIARFANGTVIKPPINGTISDLYLDVGEWFQVGTALFRVADYSAPEINFRVDEYDVHALRKGMPVTVRVLSTGRELEGEITRVSQEATVTGDLAYYAVRLSLPQDGTLPMGVSCEIIVPRQSAEGVVTISAKAVQYDSNGTPFVYIRDVNGKLAHQNIILGVSDGLKVEVQSGLQEGDAILVPPSFGFDPAAMRERMMEGMQ